MENRSEALQALAVRAAEAETANLPADFIPLVLLLRPSGVKVELCQMVAVIGRHSDADVRLPLPDVSRRHCQLRFVEGLWHIQDLRSFNGTFVNGVAIEEEATLHTGDLLRIGGFSFDVVLDTTGHETAAYDRGAVLLSISRALPSESPGSSSAQRQAS